MGGHWLAPTLIGKDPADTAAAPHPNGRDRAHDAAAAGIDCALWDLRGQMAARHGLKLYPHSWHNGLMAMAHAHAIAALAQPGNS